MNRRLDEAVRNADEHDRKVDDKLDALYARMNQMFQLFMSNQNPGTSTMDSGSTSSLAVPQGYSATPNLDPSILSTAKDHNTPILSGGLTSRLPRIEFPKFDGNMVKEWLSKCNDFFLMDSTPTEMRIRLASLHMEGKALQWHHNYMKSVDNHVAWSEYVVAVTLRFGKLFDDLLADLVSLKQAAMSVELYLDRFESHLSNLSLSNSYALSIFLTNMNPHLALHVRQFNPRNIAEAARIAKLNESALLVTPSKYSRPAFSSSAKSQQPLLPPPEDSRKLAFPNRPTAKFSFEEMQDRRAKCL